MKLDLNCDMGEHYSAWRVGDDEAILAHTLCIHGDEPNAVAFAREIRAALERLGVTVTAV